MSFWDSSAVVPLCLKEATSSEAGKLWKRLAERVVCWETPVEIISAFARQEREGNISVQRRQQAELLLTAIEKSWITIAPSTRIIELARTFPLTCGLKALDSLQLAAALVWCKEFPKNKNFVAADRKLLQAAEAAGFTIHDLS